MPPCASFPLRTAAALASAWQGDPPAEHRCPRGAYLPGADQPVSTATGRAPPAAAGTAAALSPTPPEQQQQQCLEETCADPQGTG